MDHQFNLKHSAKEIVYEGEVNGLSVTNLQEAIDALAFKSEHGFGVIYTPEGDPIIADRRGDAFSFVSEGSTVKIRTDADKKIINLEVETAAMIAAQIAAAMTVKSNDTEVDDDIDTFDFSSEFTLTETPDGEINVSVNSISASKITGLPSSTITVQSNDVTVSSVITTFDFSSQFGVTESPSGEANISISSILASVVSDFSEAVDDRVAVLIQNGTGITWSYNDGANTFTPTVTITQYTDEMAQDAIGNNWSDTSRIDFTYNDGAGTFSADIVTNSIGDTFLRQGGALSVIGRSANSTGNVADISGTASSKQVLRVSGTAIGFGTIDSTYVSDFSTAAPVFTGWTDSASNVFLTTTTDEVIIGGTSPLSSAKVSIDGDTDQIQLIVQGNATQTTSLVVWETSAGTDLMTFSNAGVMAITGQLNVDNLRLDGNTFSSTSGGPTFQTVTSSSFTFASDTADTDLTFAFTGTTFSGQFKWMEDEDYFEFNDDLFMVGGEAVFLRATTNKLYSRTTDVATLEGNTTTEIGKEGDTLFGVTAQSTLRAIYPATTAKYDIGTTTNLFNKLFLASSCDAYKNVTTAGWGIPGIYAAGRATAQTAANASVSTYTCGAADGSFIVSANVLVTTATTHNFTVTCAYTDEGNTARTLTFNFSSLAGVLATAIINTGGTVPYEGIPMHIRCKASTAITIKTTGTFTTVTYNVEGIIQQVA